MPELRERSTDKVEHAQIRQKNHEENPMARIFVILFLSLVLSSMSMSQDYSDIPDHRDDGKELKELISVRVWKDLSGKHEIRANFKRFDLAANTVVLKKLNGDEVVVALDKMGKTENECISRIIELRQELDSKLIDLMEKRNKELSQQLKDLFAKSDADKQKLLAEIQRLEVFAPSNSLNGAAGVPVVTAKRLEALGSEFVGKEVIMKDCRFSEVSSTWVDDVGGSDRYTGFNFHDSEGEYYQFAFAPRETYAEFLLALKDEQRISILGTVVNIGGNRYGIIASKIEKSE